MFKTIDESRIKQLLHNIRKLQQTKKNIPSSLDIERCVLGAILIEVNLQHKIDQLVPEDFYSEQHSLAFIYMKEMMARNITLDVKTISDHVIADKGIIGIPREFFLTFSNYFCAVIMDAIPTKNIDVYIDLLQEKTRLRSLLLTSLDIIDLIDTKSIIEPSSIVGEAHNMFVQSFDRLQKHSTVKQCSEILPEKFTQFMELAINNAEHGFSTGFDSLDELLSGLIPGNFYLIAGRPSMGKTTLGVNFIENVLKKHNQLPCLVFSLEMSATDLLTRMLCSCGSVAKYTLKQGEFMPPVDFDRANKTYAYLRSLNLFIHDSAQLTISTLIHVAKKVAQGYNGSLGLILVDYIQLMDAGKGLSSGNRSQEIGDISRALKGLARELNAPVLGISQLNRNVDDRPDRRPVLSDLRESGALEQDADVVLFIYRDEVYNRDTQDRNVAEIIVGKHRNGPIGKVIVRFNGVLSRFEPKAPYTEKHEPRGFFEEFDNNNDLSNYSG